MSDDIASLRLLNESAIREHALACSKQFRNGKYTRVGEDFLDEVKADVAAFLRDVRAVRCGTSLHDPLPVEGDFVTGALKDAFAECFNRYLGRVIQNKVMAQRGGMTLTRTR